MMIVTCAIIIKTTTIAYDQNSYKTKKPNYINLNFSFKMSKPLRWIFSLKINKSLFQFLARFSLLVILNLHLQT